MNKVGALRAIHEKGRAMYLPLAPLLILQAVLGYRRVHTPGGRPVSLIQPMKTFIDLRSLIAPLQGFWLPLCRTHQVCQATNLEIAVI